jgi:hypothetical protein
LEGMLGEADMLNATAKIERLRRRRRPTQPECVAAS